MNETPPAVSVIIPTYNWSSVLRYALASVEQQTLADFEVLVIGDGCTDDSAEVVASFRDPRFHWLNLPENHGHQSQPNNEGLPLARGQWIAYLGHDDLWMPHHLARLLEKVERAQADVGYSLAMVIGAPDCGGRKLFGAIAGPYPRGAHLPPSALLHRRSLIKEAGGWPDYRVTRGSPETELLKGFYDHSAKFAALEELRCSSFLRPGGRSVIR